MSNNRAHRFPCGECRRNCVTDCIKCELCTKWFHTMCQGIADEELMQWACLEVQYVCVSCRSVGRDVQDFDYLMAMHRLKQAADKGIGTLKEAVLRENMFKAKFRFVKINEVTEPRLNLDVEGNDVMARFCPELQGEVISTTGNGDCLFNAISLLLCGDESKAVELRYFTCLKLINNADIYSNHAKARAIKLLAPTLTSASLACARIGQFSSAWTIIALCDVIQKPIRIIYPPFNGVQDIAHRELNDTFMPSAGVKVDVSCSMLRVLWYGCGIEKEPNKYYTVNHFAAVLTARKKETKSNERPLDSPDTDEMPREKYAKINNDCHLNDSLDSPDIVKLSSSDIESLESASDMDELETPKNNEYISVDSPASSPANISRSNSFDSLFIKKELNETNDEQDKENKTERKNDSLKPLPRPGQFLTTEEIMEAISNTDTAVTDVPIGQKDNVFIVLDLENAKHSQYPDDCGVWDWKSATTVNQYIETDFTSGQFKAIYKKNGIYCVKKKVQGKATYPPMEPQPEHVMTWHRYYTKFCADENYKKRVTTFTDMPGTLAGKTKFAVVEYNGIMPRNCRPHGNAKREDCKPYIRTKPSVLKRAANMAKTQKVADVFTELAEEDSFSSPKTSRQIYDKKYMEKKKEKESNSAQSRINVADDVVFALSQLNTDPYLQEVVLTKDKKPVVIVYSEEQLLDLKRNCVGEDCSVIGVDRTFNLGRFFVTAMSYKNRTVVSQRSQDYPVMLGPCMIHFDAEETTYGKFFSHISDKIGDVKLVIGSDEEKSITNALHKKFRKAEFLLCSKHIKDNIRRYLQNTGTSSGDRNKILDIIFLEEEGIVHAENDVDFEIRCDRMCPYLDNNSKFKVYWEKYMYKKIRNYIFMPLSNKTITRLWTNNNSESMNHKLKAAVNWEKNKFPELIQKIGKIMKNQIVHLQSAIYGKGDYKLTKQMSHYYVEPLVWHGLRHREMREKLKKFMAAKPKTDLKRKYISATDMDLKCPVLNDNVGKKPGQRQRPAAERSTTFNK